MGSGQRQGKSLSRYLKISEVWFLKIQNKLKKKKTISLDKQCHNLKKNGFNVEKFSLLVVRCKRFSYWGALGWSTSPFVEERGISQNAGVSVFEPEESWLNRESWKPWVVFLHLSVILYIIQARYCTWLEYIISFIRHLYQVDFLMLQFLWQVSNNTCESWPILVMA